MPGLYNIATREPATLITALIYNFDHQVHVDGRNATQMASYGTSASQFQLTDDPFPGSVESLPPSLAGEITRMRFVLAQIKSQLSGGASVNWYDQMSTPAPPAVGARIERASTQVIPDSFGTPLNFTGGAANFNTGVWVSGSPTRFTAPSTGKYFAFCFITWAAATGGIRQVQIGVNGAFSANAVINNTAPATAPTQPQAVTGLLDLTAADYVEFAAFQSSGGGLAVTPTGGLLYFGT